MSNLPTSSTTSLPVQQPIPLLSNLPTSTSVSSTSATVYTPRYSTRTYTRSTKTKSKPVVPIPKLIKTYKAIDLSGSPKEGHAINLAWVKANTALADPTIAIRVRYSHREEPALSQLSGSIYQVLLEYTPFGSVLMSLGEFHALSYGDIICLLNERLTKTPVVEISKPPMEVMEISDDAPEESSEPIASPIPTPIVSLPLVQSTSLQPSAEDQLLSIIRQNPLAVSNMLAFFTEGYIYTPNNNPLSSIPPSILTRRRATTFTSDEVRSLLGTSSPSSSVAAESSSSEDT